MHLLGAQLRDDGSGHRFGDDVELAVLQVLVHDEAHDAVVPRVGGAVTAHADMRVLERIEHAAQVPGATFQEYADLLNAHVLSPFPVRSLASERETRSKRCQVGIDGLGRHAARDDALPCLLREVEAVASAPSSTTFTDFGAPHAERRCLRPDERGARNAGPASRAHARAWKRAR